MQRVLYTISVIGGISMTVDIKNDIHVEPYKSDQKISCHSHHHELRIEITNLENYSKHMEYPSLQTHAGRLQTSTPICGYQYGFEEATPLNRGKYQQEGERASEGILDRRPRNLALREVMSICEAGIS